MSCIYPECIMLSTRLVPSRSVKRYMLTPTGTEYRTCNGTNPGR